MRYLPLLALLSLGADCGGVKDPPATGYRAPHGEKHMTPRWGLTFWWTGPFGGISTPEECGERLDTLYDEWQAHYFVRFGHDQEPWELHMATLYEDIQLYQADSIPSNYHPGAYTTETWWYEHHQIDVAVYAPYHLDTWLEIHTHGLEVVKHGWTHAARYRLVGVAHRSTLDCPDHPIAILEVR